MHGCIAWRLQSDKPAGRLPPAPAHGAVDDELPFETPILIVEDEVLIAWTLHDMVVEMGFADVRLARNGAEAVALAADRHPGLLICDVNLGAGDDGVATAARIRATEWAPVLFITGYAGDDIRARIDSAVFGAALLRKPIEPRPLAAQLRAALLAQKPN